MKQIFLNKHYGYYQQVTMNLWCKEHCKCEFHCGSPGLENCQAAKITDTEEIPWEFESEEDATIFQSAWK